jgi:transcription elongation factor Elf1
MPNKSKKAKTKPKKTNYCMLCPKCGSTNVHPDLSKDMIAWGGSTHWTCDNCQFSAQIFPEAPEEEIKNVTKKIKKAQADNPKHEPVTSKGITHKWVALVVLGLDIFATFFVFYLILLQDVSFRETLFVLIPMLIILIPGSIWAYGKVKRN